MLEKVYVGDRLQAVSYFIHPELTVAGHDLTKITAVCNNIMTYKFDVKYHLSKDLGNAEDLSKLKQQIDSDFDIIEQRENKEILRHVNEDIDELPLTHLQSRLKTTCDVSLQAVTSSFF